jgi:hypothetical protein
MVVAKLKDKEKSQEEIDKIIAERLMTPTYLEALMQESSFIQEHVQVIPVGFDVTEPERYLKTQHYEKGNGRAYDRVAYLP